MSDEIEHFTGDRLVEAETIPEPLIEGFLWPNDFMMVLGSEKAGKSILALQMACNLSSGTKFLDKYQCKKVPIAYLQTEGKKDETAYRIRNMMKTIDIDTNNFHRLYKKFLPIDVPEYCNKLYNMIASLNPRPVVLFDDALYTSMIGDLNDNKDVRNFIYHYSKLLENFNLTSPVIHHAKRDEFFDGKKIKKGDKSSYGSVFLRAIVDHIIYLEMNKDKTRTLTCGTQRSGQVAESEDLILIQPTPLCFEIKGDYKAYEEITLANYNLGPRTKKQMMSETKLSESSADKATRHLLKDGKLQEFGIADGQYKEKIYKTT